MSTQKNISILFYNSDDKPTEIMGYNFNNYLYLPQEQGSYNVYEINDTWINNSDYGYLGFEVFYKTEELGVIRAFEITANTFNNLLTSEVESLKGYAESMVQNLDNFLEKVKK